MAKVIVTGASGFIGRHLIQALKKEGETAYIIDKKVFPHTDLTKLEELQLVVDKIKPDGIIDLATLPLNMSITEPFYVINQFHLMICNLLDLLKTGYYPYLLHLSSSEVYGSSTIPLDEGHPLNPSTPYAAAKAAQDMIINAYIKCYDVKAAIIRPFNTYGPGQDLGAVIPATIKRILNKEQPVINGDGYQKRDLVYVDDTVRGIVLAWKKRKSIVGKTLNLASGKAYFIKDVVAKICRLLDYPKKTIFKEKRAGDTNELCGSTFNTSRILNFKTSVDLDTGLERTVEWWLRKKS